MKKIRILLFLITVALAVTGCAEGESGPERGLDEVKLSLCHSWSQEGMYDVQVMSEGRANILYLDYESRQEIYLCANPNCAHQDESCTSYWKIGPDGFSPIPLTAGDTLLLVQNGPNQDGPAKIWASGKSGENRHQIYTAGQAQSIGPSFYTDEEGKYLYFQLSETVTGEGSPYDRKSLLRLNLETGEIHPLCEITGYGLCGTLRGRLVLVKLEDEKEAYYYLNLGSEEARLETEAFYTEDLSEGHTILTEDALYRYNEEKTFLTRDPLDEGELQVYDCSEYAENPDENHRSGVRGIQGNYLFYETPRKTEEGYYDMELRLLDLTSGEFSGPVELEDTLGNTIIPIAEQQDSFLVIYDYTPALTPLYAFITQEDYYHSRPNYLPFTI